MQVNEIMVIKGTVLYTIPPHKSLGEAVSTMSDLDVGSLVCFDKGKMAGMLTFREVLKAINQHGAAWQKVPVNEVMIKEPLCATADMEMDALRQLMIDNHQRYLPVMDDGILMGVVSFHDVARAVLEEQSFENRMLKAYIREWPHEKDQ